MDKAAIHRSSLRGARRSVEWIMRGQDVYRSERIQREEGARGCGEAVGWREVSSKVLTRRGGAAAGGVATSLQPHSHLRPSRFLPHLRDRIVENFVIEVVARFREVWRGGLERIELLDETWSFFPPPPLF